MGKKQHLTAPVATKEMPKGIPYIIGNEAAERFSFYGMKGILVVFMHQFLHLMTDNPNADVMSKSAAIERYHDFTAWVYLTPILGALLADSILGKYRTILSLSIVYCLGHLCLAFMGTAGLSPEWWLMSGLYLIALGSGGIKPCVSAHVGDQFGQSNGHLLSKVFGWFYISINVGAFISTMLTPWLLEWYGPHWAFGIPGVLMAIATYLFWMGRNVFIHIPPKGMEFIHETFSKEGLTVLLKLSFIFIFVAVFWSLFDQTGSSWVLQAEDLDRTWLGVTWLSSQIQSINPIMIVCFVPMFTGIKFLKWPGLYAIISKFFPLTPLRKVSIGLFVMVIGFSLVAVLQGKIDNGEFPSIGYQVFAYAILTASEVMVSITCLEFAYTQAPRAMKSVVMALFLMSVSLGNFFTAGVNSVIQVPSQISAASSLYDSLNPKDDEGKPQTLSETEISKLVSETKDINGNVMILSKEADGGRTITLTGPDGKAGSGDDIKVKYDSEGKQTIITTEDDLMNTAYDRIMADFNSKEQKLPKTDAGGELLSGLSDSWGSALQYRMVNRNSFRITSLGADKKYMTPNDIVLTVNISRPKASTDEDKSDKPFTWREKRIMELKGDEGKKEVMKSRGGITEIEFDKATSVGGQTNLEGQDYFWFFTKLMLGTAFLFVLVAFLYKPKEYLQEEDSGDKENDEDDAKGADSENSDTEGGKTGDTSV